MMNDPSFAAVLFNDRRLRLETEARAHACCVLFVVTSGTQLGGQRRSSWT